LNIEAYISSGILEQYVAGALTEAEMVQVTENINKHSELLLEVQKIEKAFIQFAELSVQDYKEKIQNTNINDTAKLNQNQQVEDQKSLAPSVKPWFRYLAAASILFLGLSLIGNIFQYSKLKKANTQIAQLENEKLIFADELKVLRANYNDSKENVALLQNPNTNKIVLKGTDKSQGDPVVYWNKKSQQVLVDASLLPIPPKDMVYQLWNITSLEPLTPNDAGLLVDFNKNQKDLFKTKNVANAVAFGITLEPKGGSKAPNLDQLYALGTL